MGLGTFLYKRWRGCGYAFKGALKLLKSEPSIQVQAIIAVFMIIAGFYFEITATEWIAQLLVIGLVMGLEGINTTAEAIADFIHPDYNKKIGHIKDIAAGAVFIAAVIATAIGGIIYLPYIKALF